MESGLTSRRVPSAASTLLPVVVLLLFPIFLRVHTQQAWLRDSTITPAVSIDTGFGTSVAISPDGNWLAVGAPKTVIGDTADAGCLQMFLRGEHGWSLATTLTAETPSAQAYFGNTVVMSNSRVVGGAYGDNSHTGRLVPFTLIGSAWTRLAELVGLAGSSMGFSLAMDGNFLVSGGISYSSSQGRVFPFVLDSLGSWTQASILSASSTSNANMGTSVAVGSGIIAAGAPGESGNKGAAYVWTIEGSAIGATHQRLTGPFTSIAPGTFLGYSIAILSSTKIVIGCTSKNIVYIFVYGSTIWSTTTSLSAPSGLYNFGKFLSFHQNRLLVGCMQKALVYTVSGNTFSSIYGDLDPTGSTLTTAYGSSGIAIAGDYAVVSDYDSPGSIATQNVYPFRWAIPTLSQSQSRSQSRSQSQSLSQSPAPIVKSIAPEKKSKSKSLGYKVAIWNGNAIISVPFCFDTTKSCDGGYIHVFQKNTVSNQWTLNAKLRNPFNNRDNKFGFNIYIHDNYLFVSVPDSKYVDKNTGVIVVYKWNSSKNTFEKESIIRYRKNDKVYALGTSISSFGTLMATGMPEYDTSATLTSTGGVHVFRRMVNDRWGQRKTITALVPRADERFGQSVSLQSETRIAISNKPTEHSFQAVYVFNFVDEAWKWVQTLADTTKPGFGWKIGFFSDLLYISAASSAGSISVYQAESQSQYAFSYTFQPKTVVADERFGFSFATDGTRFVVGTKPCDDGVGCGTKGSAYTFTKNSSNQWAQQFRYALGVADGSDGFGFDVAVSGDTILVSAPFKAISTRDGIAYFIKK